MRGPRYFASGHEAGRGGLSWWVAYSPIVVLLGWLCLTVVLFEFGPFEYYLSNWASLRVYLLAVHVALGFGYWWGVTRAPNCSGSRWDVLKIARLSLLLSAVWILLGLLLTGGRDLVMASIALDDPELAYAQGSTKGGGSVVSYAGIVMGPVLTLAICLGVNLWRELGTVARIGLVVVLGGTTLGSVASAVRSSLVVAAVLVGCSVWAAVSRRRSRLGWRRAGLAVAGVVAVAWAFVNYTSLLTEKRFGVLDPMFNPVTEERAREDDPVVASLSETWRKPYVSAVFYASHGYARLAQALDMPFPGIGWGIGNSAVLMRNFVRITGWTEFERYSYGLQLDRKTAAGGFGLLWSTFYTWIASDVTFPGSVLVVLLIGYWLGRAWRESVQGASLAAVPAFACLFFFVVSFPMNNPLQDAAGITTFAGIPLMWWWGRRHGTQEGHAGRVGAAGIFAQGSGDAPGIFAGGPCGGPGGEGLA